MANLGAVLLAQANELALAMAFVFMIISFVIKLATNRMRNQFPPGQGQRPPEIPAVRRGPAGNTPRTMQDLRDEVAEFLRKAQLKAQGQQPAPAPPQLPKRKQQPAGGQKGQRTAKPPKPKQAAAPKASAMGDEVSKRSLDAKVQQDLDHQVGTLGRLASAPSTAQATAATTAQSGEGLDLVELFRNRDRLRELMLVNEILRRPAEHWD